MSSDGQDPNAPRNGGAPEPSGEPLTSPDEILGATVPQHGPPSWVKSVSADSPSADSRSGKAVYDLDKEIDRSRALGGQEAAEGYDLVKKLGTGSFGTVWEAVDRQTGEHVAIKFFTAGDLAWEKMLDEVRLIHSVEGSRGIVIVKQVRPGGEGRRPHYVMQLANAGSLSEWLKRPDLPTGRDRLSEALRVFTRVAKAMAAVHRRGILHCDLKPGNILLHRPDPNELPEPLVADFGQAQLATDDTPALGTFFYMPPDQLARATAGTPPDTRWDVYALAAVFYEMLTGCAPRRTPELVEKIKKAPKQLAARGAIYREEVPLAPPPVEHHTLADRQLAKIVDRCLSLNPDNRPRDAGALVALLDARERWRRIRPVLALAAAATLLVVLALTALGLSVAREVTETTKKNVTGEVEASLARTAGYGTRAIDDRLQWHIAYLEQWAADVPPELRQSLDRAGRHKQGPTFDTSAMPDRTAVTNWLKQLRTRQREREGKDVTLPSFALVLVSDSDTGQPSSRGFFLGRVHADDLTADAQAGADRAVFAQDFSFRDYFHAGGDQVSQAGAPHRVIRATHISHPYRSQATDRTSKGVVDRRWKLNITTPVWADPVRKDRVIALISLGLDVQRDIEALLHPPDLDSGEQTKFNIAEQVKVALIDHRHQWIWHPDCDTMMDDGPAGMQLPHNYRALALNRARESQPGGLDEQKGVEQALPWLRIPPPKEDHRYGYIKSDQYIDLVQTAVKNDTDPEIACFTQFGPFRRSRYGEADPFAEGGPPRRWVFVAQVDRKAALNPLDEMQRKIVTGGVAVVVALILLAAGLWVWLVRLLRRLEFASYG